MKFPTRREFFARALGSLFLGGAAACVVEDDAPTGVVAHPGGGPDVGAYDVIVVGPGGVPLVEGDVVTGSANVAAVYLQNGLVKFTPISATGSHGFLLRMNLAAAYQHVLGSQGDGAFFVTPQANPPDRITVIAASLTYAEIACEWDAWDFDTGYLGTPGLTYRDFQASPQVNYEQGSSTAKYITACRVVKTVIMRRGAEGVFLGWHSDPKAGPLQNQIPSYNNYTDGGEREFQWTGGDTARVSFFSTGVQALHPDFGADSIWGTSAGGANYAYIRHLWGGIDDPNYPPTDQAAYISHQPAGFPAEQTTGPWWAASVHYANATTNPFVTYMTLRQRLEIGSFQFTAGQYGQGTLHFANEAHDAANMPHRTMCFLGAFNYTSANLALEPTADLRAMVAARANLDFELSGQVALAPETTPTEGELLEGTLEIYRGEETVYMLYATRDGAARSLTDLDLECQVRDAAGSAEDAYVTLYVGGGITLLPQTGDTLGGFYVMFSSAQTNAIPAGVQYLDVCVIDGGARHYVVHPRRVVVRDVVNQP